jgi:hemolysin activation/secretion protein
LDNFANRTTGDVRGTAQLAVSDPLRLGDDFGTQVSITSGTTFIGANYSIPVTASGLTADGSFSYLHYKVGGDLKPLDLNGHAYTGSIGAGYPIIRTRRRNLTVHVDYEQKRLRDDGLETNLRSHRLDHLGVAFVGNNVDGLFGGGITQASVIFTGGYDDLSGNRSDEIADRLSADIRGTFEKFNWQLARVQNLGKADTKWSLYAASSGQLSGGNLDSSEKFILGGPNGVRAYPVGEGPGDIGFITSIELRRDFIWPKKLRAQAIAFVDEGHILLNHTDWKGALVDISHKNEYDLGGAGFGLNVWGSHWAFRIAAAQAIGSNPGADIHGLDADGRHRRQTLWLQTSLTY